MPGHTMHSQSQLCVYDRRHSAFAVAGDGKFQAKLETCREVCLSVLRNFSVFTRVIIIIKTSSTGPSWKNKIVYKLLTQPHKHLRHGKTEKQTQERIQRLTAPLKPYKFRGQTQCIGKVIIYTSLGRQETPCKLGRATP